MSRKTFSLAAWLLIVCGGLVIAAVVFSKRTAMPWQRPPVPPPLVTIKNTGSCYNCEVAVTSDGSRIISRTDADSIRQWDVQTGKPLPLPATITIPPIYLQAKLPQTRRCIALSANGKVAAIQHSGTLVQTIQQTNPQPAIKKTATPHGATRYERTAVPRTYTQRLYRNKRIDLFDTQTGALLCSVPMPEDRPGRGRQSNLRNYSVSPDGTHFFLEYETGYSTRTRNISYKSQLWNVHQSKLVWEKRTERHEMDRLPETLFADAKTVARVEAPVEKNRITGAVRLINFDSGAVLAESGPTSKVGDRFMLWSLVVVSPNRRFIAAVQQTLTGGLSFDGEDGTIYVWDAKSRQLMWTAQADRLEPKALVFSPDSQVLASGFTDYSSTGGYAAKGKLLMWNVQDGTLKTTLTEETQQDLVEQIKLIQAAKVQQKLNRIVLQKARRGGAPFLPGDSGPANNLCFSPDGKLLAAGYSNGSIKIWKVK